MKDKKGKKEQASFAIADLLADLLNSVYNNPEGIILSSKEILEVYGISKSSYYRFIDFIKRLDYIQIIWIDSNYRRMVMKNKNGS